MQARLQLGATTPTLLLLPPLVRAHAEGPLAKERPGSPAELRLICSGRFLDSGTTLASEW